MKVFENIRIVTLEFQENSKVRTLSCELRKSPRARRINLRLKSPECALLTFPKRMTWQTAENFLNDQLEWIQRKTLELPSRISLAEYFLNGGKICLSPEKNPRKVQVEQDAKAEHSRINLDNGGIKIIVPPSKNEEMMIKHACRQMAAHFLPEWMAWAQKKTGLSPKKIRVGDQTSRWGSCSSKKTISLNWRIILLSRKMANYVIFHELCHLAEMNHSSNFWAKLEEYIPNARMVDRELTRVSRSVFGLGR